MEKHIIQFLVDALISSETQINTIDKLYNTEFGGHIGKKLSSIAKCVKISLDNGDICFNSLPKMIDKIAEIISENSHKNIVFEMIAEFLSAFSKHLKNTIVHSTLESFLTQADNLARTKHCDKSCCNERNIESCQDNYITISDNEEDFETTSPSHQKLNKETKWIYCLRPILDETNVNFEKSHDFKTGFYNQECKKSYYLSICKGFIEAMYIGIDACGKSSRFDHNEIMDFMIFTNTIENIASQNFNQEFTVTDDTHSHITNNGFINPIVQILGTSLRAILEAVKFHV